MDRRRFLTATAATAGFGVLAGCTEEEGSDAGDGDGGSGGSDGDNNDVSGDGESSGDETPEPTDEPTDTPTETAEPTEESQTATVPIGERVDGDKMSMVVREMETKTEIGEYQEADSGNTFAVLELVVKNTTDDEFIGFSGFLQTQIKDSEDYTYDQVIATSGETFQGGQLAPGEVTRGDVVYEIPEDASGLTLQFDFQSFSVFDFERVTVDLEETASAIADLDQDLKVDIHSPGDAVSYEDVEVAVNGIEFETSLDQFTEADEGTEFAIVDITTTNNTDEELHLSTLLQMTMKNGDGSSYQLSISALSSLDKGYDESQPLASDESRRGKVPYQVDEGVSPLYWIFEFDVWVDGDKTFWEVR